MKIAHIINVTEIDDSKKVRHLHVAQPLTIRSMVITQENARPIAHVELFAVKHQTENVLIPPEFQWAGDIDQYAWEHIEALKHVLPHKPLPRLKDIVFSLYNASDAEYFIYTNLDIGLFPHFYRQVNEYLRQGFDALCINRRDLPKNVKGVVLDENKIDWISTLKGKKHPGIDCFVFKRDIVPSLHFGNVFIGYPPVGQVLKTQIEANSKNCKWIKDGKWTFHIGRDRAWRNYDDPYFIENHKQSNGLYVKQFKKINFKRLWSQMKSLIPQTSK